MKNLRRSQSPALSAHQKNILIKLQHLRSSTRVIGRQYLHRLEKELIELSDFVAALHKQKGKTQKDSLRKMERSLSSLAIKPDKARRKDLKRIEDCIARLQNAAAKYR